MKISPLLISLSAMTFAIPAQAYIYYVIVDPAKSGQKSQQMAQDNMSFAERQIQNFKEMGAEIGKYITEFENDGQRDSFQTATLSAAKSEPSALQMQASMEPAIGLCELVSYSSNVVTGDDGCAFYGDDDETNALISYGTNSTPSNEFDKGRLTKSLETLKHRNPSADSKSIHTELSLLYLDVNGQAQLPELSDTDREAMDHYVNLVMGAEQTVLNEIDQTSSPEAKRKFTRDMRKHLVNDYIRASASGTYVRRSRIGNGPSLQSDLWYMRDNQLEMLEQKAEPVMTGSGLMSPRPTVESEIRTDVIHKAKLAKLLLARYDIALQQEMTIGLRTNVLTELVSNEK